MSSDSIQPLFNIEYTNHFEDWPLPDLKLFDKITHKILSMVDWRRLCEISVVFSDNTYIKELNHIYRDKDKPTNVLSFPGYDETLLNILPPFEPVPLGDIVFALETIKDEAHIQSKSFENHLTHLFVHGLLHLLGYDHETDDEAEEMEQFEIDILSLFSIPNPYEVN
ncbi:MAG: rRNA maturation RNase YbeY [Candidatus Paracaedibacteraceae bacterium]|nr:rRNA maturation RNase YbeY [Candidatus Paracaedibacteraceae bacterium]